MLWTLIRRSIMNIKLWTTQKIITFASTFVNPLDEPLKKVLWSGFSLNLSFVVTSGADFNYLYYKIKNTLFLNWFNVNINCCSVSRILWSLGKLDGVVWMWFRLPAVQKTVVCWRHLLRCPGPARGLHWRLLRCTWRWVL